MRASASLVLAFSAAASLDYPRNRRQVYLMNLRDRTVGSVDLESSDVSSVTWLDATHVLVVAGDASNERPWSYPERRSLWRVDVDTRTAAPWP